MSGTYRSWVPANTAVPALAQGALADVADAWSREWFAGEPMRALGTLARVAEPHTALRNARWHLCEGLAIGVPPAGATVLGARALGVATRRADRPHADTTLLAQVGAECLDDLKGRAAAVLQIVHPAWNESEAQPGNGDIVHRLEIGSLSRDFVLTLQLSNELFARFVRARLRSPAVLPPLGAATEALAKSRVEISAMLGRCGITVAELAELAEGDVLVLDRALDARLPLAVQGTQARRGSCTISETGDAVALKIVEALAA